MTKRKKRIVPPGEAFEPTEEQREAVCKLVSFGTTNKVIGRMLQIPERTLNRHFARELKNGREIIHAKVGLSLTEQALDPNGPLAAKIYYSKAQMGWRERHNIGFDDKDGKPIDPDKLFHVVIT